MTEQAEEVNWIQRGERAGIPRGGRGFRGKVHQEQAGVTSPAASAPGQSHRRDRFVLVQRRQVRLYFLLFGM